MHNDFFFSSLIGLLSIIAATAAYNVRENLTRTVSEIFFCLRRKGKTIKNKQTLYARHEPNGWEYIMTMYVYISARRHMHFPKAFIPSR